MRIMTGISKPRYRIAPYAYFILYQGNSKEYIPVFRYKIKSVIKYT